MPKNRKLRGMDPLYDAGADPYDKKKKDPRKQQYRSRGAENEEEYSSEEEEEVNQTFMQKLGSFLFFGCGGGTKR